MDDDKDNFLFEEIDEDLLIDQAASVGQKKCTKRMLEDMLEERRLLKETSSLYDYLD